MIDWVTAVMSATAFQMQTLGDGKLSQFSFSCTHNCHNRDYYYYYLKEVIFTIHDIIGFDMFYVSFVR